MKTFKLHGTELTVSAICLGALRFGQMMDLDESFAVLDRFAEEGGCFIDTANVYCRWIEGAGNSSERALGKWLRARGGCKGTVIATKGGHHSHAAPHISRVTEADIRHDLYESLETLGLDCIDLYWLHRDNPAVPVEEIVDIMEALVSEGLIRYYGASNYSTSRLEAARVWAGKRGKNGFSAVSNKYQLATPNAAMFDHMDKTLVAVDTAELAWHAASGIPLVPYSSTASGFFSKLRAAGAVAQDGRFVPDGVADGLPKLMGEHFANEDSARTYAQLCALSDRTGYSVQALSLASLAARGDFQLIPVTAVRDLAQLDDVIAAGREDVIGLF